MSPGGMQGGVPEYEAAARTVLQDWNSGKIAFYTEPPKERKGIHVSAQVVSQFSEEIKLDNIFVNEDSSGNTTHTTHTAHTTHDTHDTHDTHTRHTIVNLRCLSYLLCSALWSGGHGQRALYVDGHQRLFVDCRHESHAAPGHRDGGHGPGR